jgi:enoyl-CoA hydratase/carnithine racemase
MVELVRTDDVFVVTMDHGENRFSPELLGALEAALDEVASTEGPRAVVTTGTGKFFSNGLDLDWLTAHPDELDPYLDRVHRLFARYLALPCATVAALNGHTYAAGAMLAICHDRRVMRTDRGYWCLPEVDLGMPFTPGMNALIPAMLPARTAHEAMVTGRRYTAAEALAAGIVEEVAGEDEVLARAVAAATERAPKAGPNLAGIRTHLYRSVLDALGLPRSST